MDDFADENLFFKYKLNLPDGAQKEFFIQLDPKTCQLIQPVHNDLPSWTKLECNQCSNCPFDAKTTPNCPVSVALIEVIDSLKDILSVMQVDVTVETNERKYFKTLSIADAASSIIGIYMVTSGCPILDKLRPMARFHLPFANSEETVYRALSTYLLAQYFLQKKRRKPDWDLKNLHKIYDAIKEVNVAFVQRLRQIHLKDSSLNAIVHLDCFGISVNFIIDDKKIVDIESPFEVYFN